MDESLFESVTLNEEEVEKFNKLRRAFQILAIEIDGLCPQGRNKSLVMTKLEEASMWASKSITHEGK